MQNNKWVRLLLPIAAFTIIVSMVAGCDLLGGNKQGSPARELKKEPTVSVYDHKTGQKLEMPMEEYIAGVVAGEMLPDWPKEAYEAQAIVARTYTLELLKRTGGTQKEHGTDVSTDEKEVQAYNAAAISPVIREAVKDTRGQVLTYRGRYARTWFHAASGGRTARAKEGLNIKESEPPYTVRVKVAEPSAPPESKNWSAEFTMSEVTTALAQAMPDMGQVQNVKIAQRGPSGRVTKFRITTDKGTKSMAGPDFRILLGPEKMRSTLLVSMSSSDGVLKMSGRGFGHGVGMSQWGAYTMAKRGMSGSQIVRKFFKNVRVERVYN